MVWISYAIMPGLSFVDKLKELSYHIPFFINIIYRLFLLLFFKAQTEYRPYINRASLFLSVSLPLYDFTDCTHCTLYMNWMLIYSKPLCCTWYTTKSTDLACPDGMDRQFPFVYSMRIEIYYAWCDTWTSHNWHWCKSARV